MGLFKDNKPASVASALDKTISEAGLKAGTRLTVTVSGRMSADGGLTLFSTYEMSIDRDNFLISAPMQNSSLYPLSKGDAVVIRYATAQAFFEADAVVVERLHKGDLPFLKMTSSAAIRREQRRNDFRVDLLLETEVIETPEDDLTGQVQSRQRYKALINNLSGGGAALYSSVEVEPGRFLQVVLPKEVMGTEKIITAQVQSVRRPDHDTPYQYYIGVRFLFDKEKDRETLIKFTFDTQRKQMKRT